VDYTYLVVGGDLNWDPHRFSPNSGIFQSFMLEFGLILCDDALNLYQSFLVSRGHAFYKPISLYPLIDYRNFSDHLPIVLSLDINVPELLASYRLPIPNTNDVNSNMHLHYEHTRITVEPLLHSIKGLMQVCKGREFFLRIHYN